MAVEIISFTPITLQNGSAYDFRSNLNINFENIKISIDSIKTGVDTLQTDVENVKTDVQGVKDDIEQINASLAGGVGTNIVYSANQPTGQKEGDYWFKILS